jgi:hypothetical protein
MSEEVTFKISKDGQNIAVDAVGFQGSGCLETVEKFMKGIGPMGDSGRKPEFDVINQGGVRAGN